MRVVKDVNFKKIKNSENSLKKVLTYWKYML